MRGIGCDRERKGETAGVGKDERDGEKRTQDGSKEEKKMTYFLYCEKSAPTPANQHPRRNLPRMSQKRMHNYTNNPGHLCPWTLARLSRTRNLPVFIWNLNLEHILPFRIFSHQLP